jgi:rod shape-determining protein MreD
MLNWRIAMDFILIATMVIAVRVRPGFAALLGFATGLLVDVQSPDAMGSSALGLALIAFGASFVKASVFSEKPAMNAALFFLGKWGYDVIFLIADGKFASADSLGQIFLWSPLAAALTASAGALCLSIMKPLLRESRSS